MRVRTIPTILCLLCSVATLAVDWHHPLYLDRGGFWQKRIPVAIANRGAEVAGQAVTVAVGSAEGQAALAGADVRAIRVTNGDGVEMLFGVTGPDGESLQHGPVPAGSIIAIPVECAAGATTTYYIYYDNPRAWGIPRFLPGAAGTGLNGDLEKGKGRLPAGWGKKSSDDVHRNYWVNEKPHSGRRCVKTVVAPGAPGNWVSVYRPRMPITGGANYVIKAWARAEGAKGKVGWFLHVGTPTQPMMMGPLEETGEGTYDWREVTFTFTAPQEATILTMGTVLNGTGSAWFDSVSIASDADVSLTATAGLTENCPLRLEEPSTGWDMPGRVWTRRLALQAANATPVNHGSVLVHADVAQALRGALSAKRLRVVAGGEQVPFCLMNGNVLFAAAIPARTIRTFWLYAAQGDVPVTGGAVRLGSEIPSDQIFVAETEETDPQAYASLLASPANLVRNPSFESGDALPDEWPGAAEADQAGGVRYGFAEPCAFGARCASYTIPHDSGKDWVGWRQSVPVTPGHSYLIASWIRTVDVRNGTIGLHAHRRQADGQLSTDSPFLGSRSSLAGDADWTLCSAITTMPRDGEILQVHLTANATGTVQHDGVLVAEILDATPGQLESKQDAGRLLVAWPVHPVIKVFREDFPPQQPPALAVQMARNEQEPLQIALRGSQPITAARIEVDAPSTPSGSRLPTPEIGVVGYVPIDHKTSYYRSETPVWHRKMPRGGGSCDGWAGWWPDPILPTSTVDLVPGQTQPIWLTFKTTADAKPGVYRGAVRVLAEGKSIASLPYTVTVWDFALPDTHSLAAIYDVRASGGWWAEDGMSGKQLRERMMRFLAQKKLCADRVRTQPVFKREGNRIVADFTAYDESMTLFFDELKFPKGYTPGFFYIFGWAHLPKKCLGEAPYEGEYPYEGVDRSKLRPEYKRAYQECLRQYWDHMKAKGWADKLVLYISDEPHFRHEEVRAQMKAVCDMIHEVDESIPIYSSTWRHCPEWNGYLDVWGVGSYGCFPVEEFEARKADGDRIWYTTDGQMCTDTPYCAIERLLPHYCFKYDVEAYEFWGVDWLTYNPFDFGWHSYIPQSSGPGSSFYVRYPNGDGFLVYPGKAAGFDQGIVTSVRLEAARDGVEDYEYFTILQKLVHGTARKDAIGTRVLDEVRSLVEIPNPGGRYSSRILPDPERIPLLRKEVAEAILRLR
ncbi:MAG: DUF4091 domain-containing protein [Lentisphaerae bacterium]|nr:DUF4091 domain-containing protein [Lentisphaerota bacterium]